MNNAITFNVEKNGEEIRDTVLINAIKMITRRGYLDTAEETINKVIKTNNPEHDDLKYLVNINNYENDEKIKQMIIKIIPYKITSIGKNYGLADFLNSNKDIPKLLIVSSVNKRAISGALMYKNVEILEEKFLMCDLMEQVMVPLHIKLKNDEKEAVLKEYLVQKKDLPKILITDPAAIYFKGHIGDIFRIVRPSARSGISHAYRIVAQAPIK